MRPPALALLLLGCVVACSGWPPPAASAPSFATSSEICDLTAPLHCVEQ